MVVDRGFSTTNYKWNLSHNIRQAIDSIDDTQKKRVLEDIQSRRRVCTFLGQEYNHEVCQYIESLLQNKRPKNGLARRK